MSDDLACIRLRRTVAPGFLREKNNVDASRRKGTPLSARSATAVGNLETGGSFVSNMQVSAAALHRHLTLSDGVFRRSLIKKRHSLDSVNIT